MPAPGTAPPPVALADATVLRFRCPKCWVNNNHAPNTHYIGCALNPPGATPDARKLTLGGTGLADLSFVAPGRTAVQMTAYCRANFTITNGVVINLEA